MLGLLASWATTQASTQCAGEHPLGEGPGVHNLNSFGATEESVVRFAPSVGPSCWCSLSSADSLQVWMGGNSESLPLMLRLWRRSEVLEPRCVSAFGPSPDTISRRGQTCPAVDAAHHTLDSLGSAHWCSSTLRLTVDRGHIVS